MHTTLSPTAGSPKLRKGRPLRGHPVGTKCYLEAGNSVYIARAMWMLHHQTLSNPFQDSCVGNTGYYKTEEEVLPHQIDNTFAVFPSITTGCTNCELTIQSNVEGEMAIFNAMGDLLSLESYSVGLTTLRLSQPTGIYFYLATDANGLRHKGKIILQ